MYYVLIGADDKHKNLQNPYRGLRKQVLSLTLKQLKIDPKTYKNQVYALLMETGYG